MISRFKFLVFVIALVCPSAHAGLMLVIDDNGVLTGVNGLNVEGTLFNVEFVDGSCDSIFGGCTQDNFDFNTFDGALAAGQALLDQVFTGGPITFPFDANPSLTAGCGPVTNSVFAGCVSMIPYDVSSTPPGTFLEISVFNETPIIGAISDGLFFAPNLRDNSLTTEGVTNMNFIRFTEVSAPASLPILFGSLAAIAWFRRRKNFSGLMSQ